MWIQEQAKSRTESIFIERTKLSLPAFVTINQSHTVNAFTNDMKHKSLPLPQWSTWPTILHPGPRSFLPGCLWRRWTPPALWHSFDHVVRHLARAKPKSINSRKQSHCLDFFFNLTITTNHEIGHFDALVRRGYQVSLWNCGYRRSDCHSLSHHKKGQCFDSSTSSWYKLTMTVGFWIRRFGDRYLERSFPRYPGKAPACQWKVLQKWAGANGQLIFPYWEG